MTAADEIKALLASSYHPDNIARAVQMAADLEDQLANCQQDNHRLRRAYIEQQNQMTGQQEQVRYHATALLATTMPEERE